MPRSTPWSWFSSFPQPGMIVSFLPTRSLDKGSYGRRRSKSSLQDSWRLTTPAFMWTLAEIYNGEKKWPEAEKEFETALQLDPHNTAALAQLADFLTARNESAQALARVQQYVAANPNDANGHIILGAVNFQSKNYRFSQAEFERAIQLDPNNVQAYLRLGQVFAGARAN